MSDNVQGSAKFAGSHLNDNKHINVEVELVFFPLEQVLTIAGAFFFFLRNRHGQRVPVFTGARILLRNNNLGV